MTSDGESIRFDYRGWIVMIDLTIVRAGDCVAAQADLHHAGVHRCRLVLAGTKHDRQSAIRNLEEKAKAFVDDAMKP